MKGLFIFSMLFIAFAIHAKQFVQKPTKQLPDVFCGKFKLDHSENFDEYLAAKDEIQKGYNPVIRIMMTTSIFTKEFKNCRKSGKFDYSNLVEASKNVTEIYLKPKNLLTKNHVVYKNITLGRPFIAEGIDSTMHKITFDLVGNILHESHIPTEKGEYVEKTIEYSFSIKDGKEYLLVELRADDVIGKRYYKRV